MKEKKRSFFVLKAILLALVLLGMFFGLANNYYITFLWFKEVGYLEVFFKELVTRLEIFLPCFVGLTVIFAIYFSLLRRTGGKKEYKSKFLSKTLPLLLGLGLSILSSIIITNSLWDKWLIFKNAVDFGSVDPVFGLDTSFYMFKLPFFNSLIGCVLFILVVLVLMTVFYSLIVVGAKGESTDGEVYYDEESSFKRLMNNFRVQISLFLAIVAILGAVFVYLRRYMLVFSDNGVTFGASYTDIHVTLIYLTALSVVLLLFALALIIYAISKKFKAVIVVTIIGAAVILAGQGAQIIVQNYIVEPNEYAKEAEYIGYTIENTSKAYGIDDVEVVTFDIDSAINAYDIEDNKATIESIPINDYSPTLDTYNSLQSIRTYYQFDDVDIDRYYIDGEYRQVFISARELNTDKLVESAKTWLNVHLKYTHGFGIAVSPVNEVNSSGQPVLIAKDIPTKSDYESLGVDQARIYFSEEADNYIIVKTKSGEFDYPSGTDNAVNNYDGTAGIDLSLFNRIAFSIKEGTTKILFTNEITSDSVIIINRNVLDRVMSIAPYLTYDADPYIVTVNGNLYWIVDAMTTSNLYPYSSPYNLNGEEINYIRNSVKIVVDAYNGDMTFYIADEDDPIIQVYSKIYQNVYKPISEMPDELRAHIRYSEAFFNVQAKMYSSYHMKNTNTFYNQEDVWEIAEQLYGTSSASVDVNASYLIMDLPNRDGEEFMIMLPFTPRDKDNMTAWMTGLCDGDDYGKLILYQFSKQSLIYGPMQMEQRINQDTEIASALTLLGQQGSQVLRGNMLTIPINNSIIYVEPIYVKSSSGENNLPEMKKVVVCFEEYIVMSDSLADALEEIFGKTIPDVPVDPENPDQSDIVIDDTLSGLIARANQLYELANEALKNGEWAKYGEYMDELGKVLAQIQQLTSQTTEPVTPGDEEPTLPPDPVTDPGENNDPGSGETPAPETGSGN